MKNNTKKIIKITLAILLIVLVQVIGITYAKYIASDEGKGQAEIAKWSFKISKDGEQIETINLADTAQEGSTVNGKLVPGSWGSICIQVDATGSEVGVDYTLGFENEQQKRRFF